MRSPQFHQVSIFVVGKLRGHEKDSVGGLYTEKISGELVLICKISIGPLVKLCDWVIIDLSWTKMALPWVRLGELVSRCIPGMFEGLDLYVFLEDKVCPV